MKLDQNAHVCLFILRFSTQAVVMLYISCASLAAACAHLRQGLQEGLQNALGKTQSSKKAR